MRIMTNDRPTIILEILHNVFIFYYNLNFLLFIKFVITYTLYLKLYLCPYKFHLLPDRITFRTLSEVKLLGLTHLIWNSHYQELVSKLNSLSC